MTKSKPLKFRYLLSSLLLVICSISAADEYVEIMKKRAEQGNANAQFILGGMYAYGEGVPEDDAEAVRWYRMAAEQGYANAQNNLGVMYANGEGVPEDYVQAYAWYSIAAAQDNELAEGNKEKVATDMTRAQIAEAQKLSRDFWESYGPDRDEK